MDIENRLKAIYVTDEVSSQKKSYQKRQKRKLIAAAVAGLALVCASLFQGGSQESNYLERPSVGAGDVTKNLWAQYEGESRKIAVEVKERQLLDEEVAKELQQNQKDLPDQVLGKEQSADQVQEPLHLITSMGTYDTRVTWEISDPELLDYTGEILWDHLEGTEQVVTLTATLTLEGQEQVLEFPVKVTAKDQDPLAEELEKEINGDSKVYEKEIVLPSEIQGKKITYKEEKSYLPLALVLGTAVVLFLLYRSGEEELEKKYEERRKQMVMDYPAIVSRLTLYLSAGLSILESLKRMVADYQRQGTFRYAYEELNLALSKVDRGVMQRDAYISLGIRCGENSYLKLGNLLAQNLKNGSNQMKEQLFLEVTNGYQEKKAFAVKQAEEAGTKLLFPMVLMLLVVVAVVVVPAFLGIAI